MKVYPLRDELSIFATLNFIQQLGKPTVVRLSHHLPNLLGSYANIQHLQDIYQFLIWQKVLLLFFKHGFFIVLLSSLT